MIFDNSIEITLHNNEKIFFTSFLQRDNAYRIILNQLRRIRNEESNKLLEQDF